jgi:hypothetical protein
VYGVDLFEAGRGYYEATLAEFGHDGLVETFRTLSAPPPVTLGAAGGGGDGDGRRSRSSSVGSAAAAAAAAASSSAASSSASVPPPPGLFEQFCVNFWEAENVTPARYHDDYFMRTVRVRSRRGSVG